MAVIIGDIHGDIEKVKAFLDYKPDAEHVALGDLVDSQTYGVTLDDELECLDLIFSSDSILLWGNHDLVYTPEVPWECNPPHSILDIGDINKYLSNSEYLKACYAQDRNLLVRHIFTDRFLKQRHRLKAAHAVDGWLCTHAGVSPQLAKIIPQDIIESQNSKIIAGWLNEEFEHSRLIPVHRTSEGPKRSGSGPLFSRDWCRGGEDRFGGIFWFDPDGEQLDPSPLVGRQIFGHTPVPSVDKGPHWINLNTFGDGIWIYDTEEKRLCNLKT